MKGRSIEMKILLLVMAIIVLLLAACSKDGDNKKGTAAPPASKPAVTEKAPPEETRTLPKEEEKEPVEGEMPTLDISKYANHQGVVFLMAYTELIKAQRYSEAAKYFTSDMLQEIGEYGYENAEKYLKDIFADTAKIDIQLVLYEVDADYVISGVTRTDGTTPFSASLAAKKWELSFAPFN